MKNQIPIGKLIQEHLKKNKQTVVWLAKKMNCSRSAIYKIFGKQRIDTDLLMCFCEVLNVNFFDYYCEWFNKREKGKSKPSAN